MASITVALGTVKRRQGQLEEAGKLYETVLYRDKGDPEALRAMGILCLLTEKKEEGLSYVRKAYESSPDTMYVKETFLIALMENGAGEEAETLRTQFEGEGVVFDEMFDDYTNGVTDLYHYYVNEGEEG